MSPASPLRALSNADLVLDAVYEGGTEGNIRDDPLRWLLPGAGNQGGFRAVGGRESPKVVALFTTGRVAAWPDELDEVTGTFTYYGDNQHPGRLLHDTQRGGNAILRDVFTTYRDSEPLRSKLPVFLVFQGTGHGRDIRFRGLAVPGSPLVDADDELAAVWRSDRGHRFQNYRARFTILDVPVVGREWLRDILAGHAVSPHAPTAWLHWVQALRYESISAPPLRPFRSREEQLPTDLDGWLLLERLYERFQPSPHAFEPVAARLAALAVSLPLELTITRPTSDGGRDAFGYLRVGPSTDPVAISIALEAKCYSPRTNGVGVRELSRLISRLRHRDLGFLVTTSYVATQAYNEVREDQHPVVILSGGDLVRTLRTAGVVGPDDLDRWLQGAN